jgi:ankyrin repeat protein
MALDTFRQVANTIEDNDFLKQLFEPLIQALQEGTEDEIEIDFINKEGDRETFTSVSSATKEQEKTETAQQKAEDLYKAIETENVEEALKLIADADDLTGKDKDGNTALLVACKKGNLDIVSALLEQGAAVDATSTEGNTPFMEASQFGHTKSMERLLEFKANLNAQNKKGQTALWLAVDNNQLNATELLLKKKAKMELLDTETQNSALMNAVLKGNADMVDMLLKRDANPNVINPKTGLTPFTQALTLLWSGATNEAIKASQKRIATAFVSDTTPSTLAGSAKSYGKSIRNTITKTKLTLGPYAGFSKIDATMRKIDVNVPMGQSTPLLLAIENKDTDMIMWLVAKGAKLTAQGTPKKIPLFVGLESNDKPLIELLLLKGANVNDMDEAGDTPLLLAIKKQKDRLIELFVEKGSTLNKQGNEKKIPLFLAIANDDLPLVQFLLEKGANVNEADNNGDTPLLTAAHAGNKDIVERLLIYGASPNQKNTAGVIASAVTADPEIRTLLDTPTDIAELKTQAGVTMFSGPPKQGRIRRANDIEEGVATLPNPLATKGPKLGPKGGITTLPNPLTKKGTGGPEPEPEPEGGSEEGSEEEPEPEATVGPTQPQQSQPPRPILNNTKVLTIGATDKTRRGHDRFDGFKPIISNIFNEDIHDNEYDHMPDKKSLTLLTTLNAPEYAGKTYDMVLFLPDCQLEKIFTTNNYTQLILKLYLLVNPNGYVLFTESPFVVQVHNKNKSNQPYKLAIAAMNNADNTGTIEQIDIAKKYLPMEVQKQNKIFPHIIHPFPDYSTLNGKQESFLVPFIKEWDRYFLQIKEHHYIVYKKRPTPVLSKMSTSTVSSPSRSIVNPIKSSLPTPLKTPARTKKHVSFRGGKHKRRTQRKKRLHT